jgi:glycosyltransferase involved in cell wall biosynthesis
MPTPDFSVILPAFNEEAALPIVIQDLIQQLGDRCEIIVVDDGSSDSTASVSESLGVQVVSHSMNKGKGAAMATGVEAATTEILIFIDADATYPVSAINELEVRLKTADIVRAERPIDSENIPAFNRLGNRVFNQLLSRGYQLEGKDLMSGLYGMSRKSYQLLQLDSAGFDVEVEIGIKAKQLGLKVVTFDIEYFPRIGEKKLRPFRDGFRILSRIAQLGLLYSPTLTFVVPGIAITVLALVGALILSEGPVIVGPIGFSQNSLVLATIGVLGGFQLVIFGIAANLYRLEIGRTVSPFVSYAVSRPSRMALFFIGFSLSGIGLIWLIDIVWNWLSSGAGSFESTGYLSASASLFVFGIQMMSAGLFLTLVKRHSRIAD